METTPEGLEILDPFELRVLAEKEALTPDNYPLSLNALVNGCNQLSSRDPVMSISEDTVAEVLQRLMQNKYVNGITQAGARVTKYEHRLRIKHTLEQDKLAVLTLLMLRGLQTAGEIRTRSGRLHDFKSVAEVLQRLMQAKYVNGITQAGARVTKYEHRLRIKFSLEQDKLAVLTMLMLRGLQTAGEIRTRTGRLHEFKSVTEVEHALQFLIDKYPPLVSKLPLAPGTKEPRYGHLLAGEEALAREETAASLGGSVGGGAQGSRVGALEQEVQQLRRQVEELTAQFAEFRQQFE